MANTYSETVSVITPQPDDDLTIVPPTNITINATGPKGSIVAYPVPTVTDGDDPSPPAASCTPASGAWFRIKTTTVTCTATDPDDTPSTVTASFTVTVNGAAAQLAALDQTVQGVGPGTILATRVAKAQSLLTAGNTAEACTKVTGFIQEVKAQSGQSIAPAQAAQLIGEAKNIKVVLAC